MDYLAFLQKEIHAAAFATLAEDGRPEVRIIDIMLYDGHSLYFLTAKGKAFYRQLIEQKFVAITGEKGRRAVSLRGHVRVADPALLEEAKTEFQRRTAAGYTCPIPADAVPTIAD